MPTVFAQNILSQTKEETKLLEPGPSEQLLESPDLLDQPHPSNLEDSYSDPLRTLIEWKALSRPFKKRDRSFYTTVAILVILFSPIALFLGGKTLFMALIALGFVVYVFNLVPPEEIDYKLSIQGVTVSDHFYHWQELDSFWISQKDGHKILNILTQLRFPGVLMLIIDETKLEEIKRICARFLPFHEIVPKTIIEKWSESLQKHFPLENPHK